MTSNPREVQIDGLRRLEECLLVLMSMNDVMPFLPAVRVALLDGTLGWVTEIRSRMELAAGRLEVPADPTPEFLELQAWWIARGFGRDA